MNFELDDAQRAWRDEVREFLREHVTDDVRREQRTRGSEQAGPASAEFMRQVFARGWAGLSWPVEFGGLGKGPVWQHILVREMEHSGAPSLGIEVTSIGPMIMRHGTEQNRAEFLPPIARGELTVALGYSEPNSGTDLASLRTRAVLERDEWVITGQKIWNSTAHSATHEWLCVRTGPPDSRHRGISVIIVALDTPGIEVRPLMSWGGMRTNEAFFTDVRVPSTNLIGEVNQGWRYITGALDLERGAITKVGELRRTIDDIIEVARVQRPDGVRPLDNADVRRQLAQLDADTEAAELMGLESLSELERGRIPTVTATVEKIFTSELRQRIADVATRLLGMYGLLTEADDHAVYDGHFERLYREAPLRRFGGGANEVLRDVVAQRGHGLPPYGR